MSLADFAKRIGVREASVWRYEHGRIPGAKIMRRIIDEFGGGLTADDYFSATRDPGEVEQDNSKFPDENTTSNHTAIWLYDAEEDKI